MAQRTVRQISPGGVSRCADTDVEPMAWPRESVVYVVATHGDGPTDKGEYRVGEGHAHVQPVASPLASPPKDKGHTGARPVDHLAEGHSTLNGGEEREAYLKGQLERQQSCQPQLSSLNFSAHMDAFARLYPATGDSTQTVATTCTSVMKLPSTRSVPARNVKLAPSILMLTARPGAEKKL